MTLLGEVGFERSRYRRRGVPVSWMPVDESLGLMGGWMTRPAAEAAVMTVAHCTWQDAEQLLQKAGAMTPSASALQDLVRAVHEHWSTAGETVIPQVREAEGIPGAAVSAVISLDGVMGNRRLLISGVVVDLVYEVEAVPRAGKEAMMTGFRVMTRGGFRAMVAVCRAGMAVTYGSSIGTGPFADIAMDGLQAERIPVLLPRYAAGDQGCCCVLVDPAS